MVGPRVEADDLGGASPAWQVLDHGHTTRGWPWYLLRKRGGALRRITLAPSEATAEGTADAISRAVASMRSGPLRTT